MRLDRRSLVGNGSDQSSGKLRGDAGIRLDNGVELGLPFRWSRSADRFTRQACFEVDPTGATQTPSFRKKPTRLRFPGTPCIPPCHPLSPEGTSLGSPGVSTPGDGVDAHNPGSRLRVIVASRTIRSIDPGWWWPKPLLANLDMFDARG